MDTWIGLSTTTRRWSLGNTWGLGESEVAERADSKRGVDGNQLMGVLSSPQKRTASITYRSNLESIGQRQWEDSGSL